jgi:hypothetical protein
LGGDESRQGLQYLSNWTQAYAGVTNSNIDGPNQLLQPDDSPMDYFPGRVAAFYHRTFCGDHGLHMRRMCRTISA